MSAPIFEFCRLNTLRVGLKCAFGYYLNKMWSIEVDLFIVDSKFLITMLHWKTFYSILAAFLYTQHQLGAAIGNNWWRSIRFRRRTSSLKYSDSPFPLSTTCFLRSSRQNAGNGWCEVIISYVCTWLLRFDTWILIMNNYLEVYDPESNKSYNFWLNDEDYARATEGK